MNALTKTENNALAPRGMGFDLSPQNFDQALTFSNMLAESDLVPKDFKGKPGNCLIAMQWGAELGLKPLQAIQNIAVINGRPALWGDAVIALVRSSPVCEYVLESDDGHTATCRAKRKGEPEQIATFGMDDAKQAGLSGKQGPWSQYPKRMRQLRARAFALRDVFADVLRGMPIAEELRDLETAPVPGGVKHMGAAEEVKATLPDYPAEKWAHNLHKWVDAIATSAKTLDDVLAWLRSKNTISTEQEQELRRAVASAQKAANAEFPAIDPGALIKSISEAVDLDTVYELGSQIEAIEDDAQRLRVTETFDARVAELEG